MGLGQGRRRRWRIAAALVGALVAVLISQGLVAASEPVLTDEPSTPLPAWTLGDLVWRDEDGNGVLGEGEVPLAGVPIEILDADGDVVATTTTRPDGRWIVQGLPEGTFRAHLPASAFAAGGALEGLTVSATAAPHRTGVDSAPVTLSYVRDAAGAILGGGAPLGDNVEGLAEGLVEVLVPDDFTDLTIDLALVLAPPSLTLTTSAGEPVDVNENGLTDAGDTILYSFLLENTGGIALTELTVDDLLVGAVLCPVTTLAVAGSTTCVAHAPHVITRAEEEAGVVHNRAAATGDDPAGDPVVSDPSQTDTPTESPLPPESPTLPSPPHLDLPDPEGPPAEGRSELLDRIDRFVARGSGSRHHLTARRRTEVDA